MQNHAFILELSDFCSFIKDHIMPSFHLYFEKVLFVFFHTYDMYYHKGCYLINLLLLLAKFTIGYINVNMGEESILFNFKGRTIPKTIVSLKKCCKHFNFFI